MKTIKLSQTYTTHTSSLNEVTFREPTFNDIMEFGEPVAAGVMAGGVYVENTNYEAVLAYAERLVQRPWDGALLGQLNVKDTRAVVREIKGFFREPEASPAAQKTSSSLSGGTQRPSAT